MEEGKEGDQEQGEFDEEELLQANNSLTQVPPSSTLKVHVSASKLEPLVATCISPTNVNHVSSTSASEFARYSSRQYRECLLRFSLYELSATMLDDFDKFMNDSTPKSNESSLENPTNFVTMTSPIVTTIV